MSISSLFEKLHAPLKNSRWSWGAVRASDETVILRVWQDRKFVENRVSYMMITHHSKYTDKQENLGYQQRLEHVHLVKAGARCYMVMCRAKDTRVSPREIASYNDREIFVGGEVCEREGDTWIKLIDRISVVQASQSV